MTQQPTGREPEYIITETDLRSLISYRLSGEQCIEINNRVKSRPYSPAPERYLKHLLPERRGCLTCHNTDCDLWITADQNCWQSQANHDEAIRQSERENVISEIIEALNEFYDEVKEDRKLYRDGIDVSISLVESLRAGKEQPE